MQNSAFSDSEMQKMQTECFQKNTDDLHCCFWLKRYENYIFCRICRKQLTPGASCFLHAEFAWQQPKKHLVLQILYFLHLKCLQKTKLKFIFLLKPAKTKCGKIRSFA